MNGRPMARALRIELAGAWYHEMNRGHRGTTLFHKDTDRRRLLGLLAEWPERFALEVHAFVLMDNRYHLARAHGGSQPEPRGALAQCRVSVGLLESVCGQAGSRAS